MRKLIVLIMTSVLATGAVAQADEVNVTEDAGDLIFIDSIFDEPQAELFNSSTLLPTDPVTDVTSLQPTKPTSTIGSGRDLYSIRGAVAQTQNGADIEQIAVCFYDTRVGGEVADLCGYGSDEDNLAATMGDKGTNSPDSAFQAIVKTPSLSSSDFYGDQVLENDNEGDNVHYVQPKPASKAYQISGEAYFKDGETKDAVYFVVRAGLSHAMAFGDDAYKVRVAAIYDDNSVFTLTDDTLYSVAEYRSIETDRSQTVDYGDVIPGGDKVEQDGIRTGEFYANHSVDVKFNASKFKLDPEDPADPGIDFATSTSLTANAEEFALECILDSGTVGTDEFIVSEGSTTIISDQPGSNTNAGDKEGYTTLDTHDCDLWAGGGVSIGSYSNTIDVQLTSAG